MTNSNLAPIPELFVSAEAAAKLKTEAGSLPSWDLTARQACDLELLMNGGFHPLQGFHSEADYNGVVENLRTADGTLWPIPVTLDVSEKFADTVSKGGKIALRDAEGVILAVMTVTDKWTPNKAIEAEKVFGADDLAHPAVQLSAQYRRPGLSGRPGSGSAGARSTMISRPAATRRMNCAPISARSAGTRSWPSRPATRCTAPTRN